MPVNRVFLSWSLMMMKGLPYSSNASVPKVDMLTDVSGHLASVQRIELGVFKMETWSVAKLQAARVCRRLLEGSTGGEGGTK